MDARQQKLFRQMLAQSWEPREWFAGRGDYEDVPQQERKRMWVYLYNATSDKFLVGFYCPERQWHQDSTQSTREAAQQRVHYLNGGNGRPSL